MLLLKRAGHRSPPKIFRQRHVQQPERRRGCVVLHHGRRDREVLFHSLPPRNPRDEYVVTLGGAMCGHGLALSVSDIMRAMIGGENDYAGINQTGDSAYTHIQSFALGWI